MDKLKVEYRNVADLNPYENNPRLNDGAVDAVAASIKEFGFKVPIVVDSDGVIVTGHTRLKAAKKLGIDTVPVIVADDLTPEQVKAFRLADNKTGELAQWDLDKLDIELDGIDEIDMGDFGCGKGAHDLELDGDVYYLCGVSRPYKWKNNFHLAFRRKNGSNIECSDNGVSVVIEGAERLPIDDKYNNPSDSHYRTESYSTCRNWQFANYFETHLKRGIGNAAETIAH